MVAPIPIAHRAHVIKLSVQSGEKLRDYFLDCGTEVELNQWVKCLANVCGFCPGETLLCIVYTCHIIN